MPQASITINTPGERFILQTDASNIGLGAVLSQLDSNGEERPVMYLSKKFSKAQENYSTIEKECFAVVQALKTFYVYLDGQEFTLETDHQPLVWLMKMKNNNQRLMRWALYLSQFRMKIGHRSGKEHGNADILSRLCNT